MVWPQAALIFTAGLYRLPMRKQSPAGEKRLEWQNVGFVVDNTNG